MTQDIAMHKEMHAAEPESRVKMTINKTFSTKFKEILNGSHQIQTEFKAAIENTYKKQLMIVLPKST